MAHFYLVTQPGPYAPGDEVTLEGDEAHHAARVARLTVGERVVIGDGRGSTAEADAIDVGKNQVTLEVVDAHWEPAPTRQVWLAQALAKGDRDESAIQMACELGIDGVIPYAAERSVSVWRGDKVVGGQERWRKILLEASKQSMRSWIPEVSPMESLGGLIERCEEFEVLVLDPDADATLSGWTPTGDTPILMVVGPEGGLSPGEIESLSKAGATTYRLGSTVLRTSTAAPAALALVNKALGRW